MSNRIPRKFHGMTGEILINTSHTNAGDVLHITKNSYGYLALNKRTGKYTYVFPSMIRNTEIFKITEIMK